MQLVRSQSMSTDKLISKEFVIIFMINFFAIMQFNVGIVALTPYILETFQATVSIAGLASGVYVFGALIGRITGGSIIGSLGTKKLLRISSVCYFLTALLYLLKLNLLFLIINRLLHGVAYGIVATTAATIIAKIVPESRQGEGIGYYGLSTILAIAIGPFVAIFLLQHTNYNIMFLCNVLFAAIGLILSFTKMSLDETIAEQAKEESINRFAISNYIELKAMPIGCIGLIVALVYSSVLTFLSLYATRLHLEEASSYFFLVCAIVVLFTRPIAGRIFDAKGPNIVLIPSLGALSAGVFLYATVSNAIVLMLSAALFGLGWGNFHSCAQALVIKQASPHRYGVATATYFILYEVGLGSGPYFCGHLVQLFGLRILYLIMGGVTALAIVIYFILKGKDKTGTIKNSGPIR